MGRVGDRVAVRVSKTLRKPNMTFAMFEMAGGTSNRLEAQ
jgi:flagellar motor switch protein FliM